MKPLTLFVGLLVISSPCRADIFSLLGDLEGLGQIGEVARAIDQTRGVLGYTTSQSSTAAIVNRGVGQYKNSTFAPNSIRDLPYVVRDVKELDRYVNGAVRSSVR